MSILLESLYIAADVRIHAARSDPYPIVILETMGSGLRLSLARYAEKLRTGSPPASTDFRLRSMMLTPLAEAMTALATDAEPRNRVGRAARQTASDHDGIERFGG